MKLPYLTGYCDRLSVMPGDDLQFMVSAHGADTADAQLVRIVHGDENPAGPGFVEHAVDAGCNGNYAVFEQSTQAGSYVEIASFEHFDPSASFTLHAFVWSTTPGKGEQAFIACRDGAAGVSLGLDAQGSVALWLGDGTNSQCLAIDSPVTPRIWYFVSASYDAGSRALTVRQVPVVNAYNSHLSPAVVDATPREATGVAEVVPKRPDGGLLLAGHHAQARVVGLYNGKLDRPGIHARVLSEAELDAIRRGGLPPAAGLLCYWDTTAGYTAHGIGDEVVDRGPHGMHGTGRNRPVRAMTGYNWNGRDDCFRLDPTQYGGIYFNDDAITDCRWQPTFKWRVQDDLKSGVYAMRLRANGLEDHIVFFVRPRQSTAKVAMLMPTASYLAYANERFVLEGPAVEAITGHTLVLNDVDYLLGQHLEWGRSSYDHHSDGAGVCYSSYLRPIMGLRPRHRMAATDVPWQFAADLSIVYWLEQSEFDYDIITDEDLHRDGVDCLRPYRAVLNGTHSEYYSEAMMDATEAYIAGGGNVMYLGANGYYWVVAFRDEELWCMEIRKLDSGSRAWQAAPGEAYMATNGERGGIWRNRGRPPQKLTGVGFTSEGMDESKPYRRMPDSHDPAVAWIFDGVDGETFGDFGLGQGGAAGLELDRYDLSLGTPAGTWLLASSEGHSDNYPHVSEEVMFNFPGLGGTQDFQVRADVTYFETTGGGAVFSTGSIAWGQALPCNDTDNDVARITANVLRRFVAGAA